MAIKRSAHTIQARGSRLSVGALVVAAVIGGGCAGTPSERSARAERLLDSSHAKTNVVKRTEGELGVTYRLANPNHAPIDSIYQPPSGYVALGIPMPATERTYEGPAPDLADTKCRIGVIDRPVELIVDITCLY